MPIYAYRCESCGFTKDVLQKMSDAPLTECSSCNKSTFRKQLTAAGFQLKGTGWYVTDFRNGNSGGASAPASTDAAPAAEKAAAASDTSASSTPSENAASTTSAA